MDTEKHNAVLEGSFSLFLTLPTELRLKIWELALPGPRFVELEVPELDYLMYHEIESPVFLSQNQCGLSTCYACGKPHPFNAVNMESRRVFLDHFDFCFGTFVSWKTDTFYLDSLPDILDGYGAQDPASIWPLVESFLKVVKESKGGQCLGSIAIDVDCQWTEGACTILDQCHHLKEILLVDRQAIAKTSSNQDFNTSVFHEADSFDTLYYEYRGKFYYAYSTRKAVEYLLDGTRGPEYRQMPLIRVVV